ncbi:NUDIX hydrolase [Candidatus Eisenbacteria bacterium]|uniref:NUDIX hydrolase n=1 Tax=Eiseniibacteriota bacterium TaxID=2212470 RepID=A0ABV6YIX7_UNCEI
MKPLFDWARKHLEQKLQESLPGADAQRLMAAKPRPGWLPDSKQPEGKPAAVLVLIYPLPSSVASNGEPALLLTERTAFVEAHRRQISFPGGGIEPGETPEQAALRETFEETGIPPELPKIIGRLSKLWIPATGYSVLPIVATADTLPPLRANPREVERILEVPLSTLLEPGAVRLEERSKDGRWRSIRYFDVEGSWLWGATAMMMAELLVLLGWRGPDV